VTLSNQKQSVTDRRTANGGSVEEPETGRSVQYDHRRKHTSVVKDVLDGRGVDCSGQSNMEFTVSKKRRPLRRPGQPRSRRSPPPTIPVRVFTGKQAKNYEPQTEIQGRVAGLHSGKTCRVLGGRLSVFPRSAHREIKKPVGFITLAYGASTAEAWIRRETIAADPL